MDDNGVGPFENTGSLIVTRCNAETLFVQVKDTSLQKEVL
jgi:hypothetical protein